MKLIAKYKCRYCDKVFSSPSDSSVGGHRETIIHNAQDYAENPHLGCADFIGYEVIREVD